MRGDAGHGGEVASNAWLQRGVAVGFPLETTSKGEAGVYLLEVNTQPGMTPLSLVPEQAQLKGIAYGELVERLIEEALQ